jgi:hypothetical protein
MLCDWAFFVICCCSNDYITSIELDFTKADTDFCIGMSPSWHRQVRLVTPAPETRELVLTNDSWCMVGTEEYQVVGPTRTQDMQPQYTDCHTHGVET